MPNLAIISFSNGEVSQKIDSRIDTQKNSSSCRSLKNMLPLVYGCVERRPGLKFIMQVITPVINSILLYIFAYENSVLCYENEVMLSTEEDSNTVIETGSIPVFSCYENDVLCYENEPVSISDDVLTSNILCYENDILFYENEILTY